MNLFKKVLLTALMLGILTTAAIAAEPDIPDEHLKDVNETENEQISILCVGNSILNHGPAEGIGWNGSWGMAASAKEKDYYHLLQEKVKDAGYTDVLWSAVTVAPLERAIDKRTDYDYKGEIESYLAPSVNQAKPDVVIFQIGENVDQDPTAESYKTALKKCAEYCMSVNPDVQIIFCMPFWGGEAKCTGAKNAAGELGYTYADLSQFHTAENMAVGLFEHDGVASHPGDTGMENIAGEIFGQLNEVLCRKYTDAGRVQVKLDGKYMCFDVPARIVSERTMIPVRAVAEAFGAKVSWEESTKTVTIIRPDTALAFRLGESSFTKNGKTIALDAPAFETDGSTLLPARALAEALDCTVDWDEAAYTVMITSPEKAAPFVSELDNSDDPQVSGADKTHAVLTADSFTAGSGYRLVSLENEVTEENSPVTVADVKDGVAVSHGGYYQDGVNWGGIACNDAHTLDGLSVTVRFDEVPEVKESDDCWISFDFLTKPQLFRVGAVADNPGFMSLVRFGSSKWEIYEGVSVWKNIMTYPQNEIFAVKTGDVVTVSAELNRNGFYEFTYTNGNKTTTWVNENSQFGDVFKDGKAYAVISASLKGSEKDAFRYTVTDISYID